MNIWENKKTFLITFTNEPFISLLNTRRMLENTSHLTDDLSFMKVKLHCQTQTNLLSKCYVNGMATAYEIVRNDYHFDKFKSSAVLHNKQIFKIFRPGEHFYYICNISDFNMLIVYRKHNSNIAQFRGYITYLEITKHTDCILGDFNEDSSYNRPRKISLQSLGFSQVISEATQIRSSSLDKIYIQNAQKRFTFFEAKVGLVCFSDHDPVLLWFLKFCS